MSDDIVESAKATQEVAKAAQKGIDASEKLGGFLAKVFGGPMEDLAGMVGDKLRVMRWERQVRLIDRVEEINRSRKVLGKEVPVAPKLAIPLIESASLEENDTLQDLWARLLSSAQDERMSEIVRTAFIDIIKQLEVIDVETLNSLYGGYKNALSSGQLSPDSSPSGVAFSKMAIIRQLKITERQYENSIDNLMRVRCVRSEVKIMHQMNIGGQSATIDMGYESLCITSLGISFVQACVRDEI